MALFSEMMDEAGDLKSEIARLRKALERIAQGANIVTVGWPHHPGITRDAMALIARDALNAEER